MSLLGGDVRMCNLEKEVERYIEYCSFHKKLSSYTIKAYVIDIRQYILFCGKMTVDREVLTKYVESLLQKYKPKTVKRKTAAIKAFFNYLYRRDIIEDNPFNKIDIGFREPKILPKTIPQHIIRDILCALYFNIDNSETEYRRKVNVRNAAVVELLFATGARVSEICSLGVEDVDLISKTVKIFGKGSKERVIQLENQDVIDILCRYKDEYNGLLNSEHYFFLNNRNGRLSEQSVRKVISDLEKQVSSPIHITPHMFRHSVATLLLEEDVDIRYIQKILGHSSITTTQIYTHVTSAKQREILRTKHPRNKIHIRISD